MKKNLELEIILYLRTPSMQLMSRIQLIFDNLVYEVL